MTEINKIILWFPIDIINSIIFIIFVILFYFIWKYFNKNKIYKQPEKKIFKEKVDFKKIISDFEKNNISNSPEIFYSKLLEIIKEILEQAWVKNISKMTFEEINMLKIKQNLKDLIKNIYFKEYMRKIEDNTEIRKNLISETKKLIK